MSDSTEVAAIIQAVPAEVDQEAYTDLAAPALQESVRLTNAAGQTWQAPAAAKYRPDVAGYFVNQALVRSGFDVELDLSGLQAPIRCRWKQSGASVAGNANCGRTSSSGRRQVGEAV